MNEAHTIGQMHVRLSRYLPRDLAAKVNPIEIQRTLEAAWINGWRDPEWLVTYALEGTEHPRITDAAALFMSRLKDASAQPCPDLSTPAPPSVADVRAAAHAGHQPAGNPSEWAARCRRALNR